MANDTSSFTLKKWSVLGHEKIVKRLKDNIVSGKLPHAFLFSGPANIGKTLVAYNFIKSIQCRNKIRPCGICESCRKIERGLHPDIVFLEQKKTQKIQDIRKLKHKLSLSPSVSPYKICLLNVAENLTKEASNALLKVLEEPKGRTVIILTSENYERLLPTIISRCILFKFFIPSSDEIRAHFFSYYKDKTKRRTIEELILNSGRKPGIIHSYLKDPKNIENINRLRKDFEETFSVYKSDYEKISLANKIASKDNTELKKIFSIWLLYFRNLMFFKLKIAERKDLLSEKLLKKYSIEKIRNNILEINRTILFLSKNINRKLLIENLIMNL